MALATEALELPLLVPGKIEPRAYQINLYRSALTQNTLVVLPTGLGKTVVALLLAAEALHRTGRGKSPARRGVPAVVLLAPTKPLVEQHAAYFREHLIGARAPGEEADGGGLLVADLTGETAPEERLDLWGSADVVVATPQVVRNDLLAQRISLAGVELLVLDEAHRATGDYAYVSLAECYREQSKGRLLGMTASPGGNARTILEICKALGIRQIGVRTEDDPDVKPYVHEIDVSPVGVDVPGEFKVIAAKLRRIYDRDVAKLQAAGAVRKGSYVSVKEIIQAQSAIQGRLARAGDAERGKWWDLASAQARAMKLNHALEYLETQGVEVFRSYMQRLLDEAEQKGGSRASKVLLKDPDFREAFALAIASTEVHPKVPTAVQLVVHELRQNPAGRVILFAHFRETAELLVDRLSHLPGIRPVRFVGQQGKGQDRGLTQKEQVRLIKEFTQGTYNVLVATSVAEEGLDIPQVDLVVFFEPIPSEIRTIQRRGRTGRRRAGKVIVLYARKTRDEAYLRASAARENTMRDELRKLRQNMRLPVDVLDAPSAPEIGRRMAEVKGTQTKTGAPQRTLGAYEEPSATSPPASVEAPRESQPDTEPLAGATRVVIDDREAKTGIPEELARRGVPFEIRRLELADFLIGKRVAVERKTADDLAASVADGRLFAQARQLALHAQRPLLLVEGDIDSARSGVGAPALKGALLSLAADFGIPVLFARDASESAALIASLAKEPKGEAAGDAPRLRKSGLTMAQRQRYVLEGLPGVSETTAGRLLEHFGSVRAVTSAPLEELAAVPGIGRRMAEKIFDVMRAPYRADRGTDDTPPP